MNYEIKLPELGDEAGEEAEVSFWYADPGDMVEEDGDLIEMVTDKAAFTVPAPKSGKLIKVICSEGDNVQVGQTMGILDV